MTLGFTAHVEEVLLPSVSHQELCHLTCTQQSTRTLPSPMPLAVLPLTCAGCGGSPKVEKTPLPKRDEEGTLLS